MKPIEKDEIYNHISGFLKARGIELQEGSYARGIQAGCGLLTEAINMGQEGVQLAKAEMDKRLDQMRQVIHEQTAPKPPAAKPSAQTNQAGSKPPPRKRAGSKKSKSAKKRA